MVFTKFSHFLEKYFRKISLRFRFIYFCEKVCEIQPKPKIAGNPSLYPLIIEDVKSTKNIKNGLTPFDCCGCQVELGTFRLFLIRSVPF